MSKLCSLPQNIALGALNLLVASSTVSSCVVSWRLYLYNLFDSCVYLLMHLASQAENPLTVCPIKLLKDSWNNLDTMTATQCRSQVKNYCLYQNTKKEQDWQGKILLKKLRVKWCEVISMLCVISQDHENVSFYYAYCKKKNKQTVASRVNTNRTIYKWSYINFRGRRCPIWHSATHRWHVASGLGEL